MINKSVCTIAISLSHRNSASSKSSNNYLYRINNTLSILKLSKGSFYHKVKNISIKKYLLNQTYNLGLYI